MLRLIRSLQCLISAKNELSGDSKYSFHVAPNEQGEPVFVRPTGAFGSEIDVTCSPSTVDTDGNIVFRKGESVVRAVDKDEL